MANALHSHRFEIDFRAADEADVVLLVTTGAAALTQQAEVCLFCLYAARQLSNLSATGDVAGELGELLLSTGTADALPSLVTNGPGDLKVSFRAVARGRSKGFRATFEHGARLIEGDAADVLREIRFRLDLLRLGKLARGVSYYGPASVLALLYALAARRRDDDLYVRRLGSAAATLGAFSQDGGVGITDQLLPALQRASMVPGRATSSSTLPARASRTRSRGSRTGSRRCTTRPTRRCSTR